MNDWIFKDYHMMGFDLDGTLYDEFDFISQAYNSISGFISKEYKINKEKLLKDMVCLWLRYGSSKTDLFQTAFNDQNIEVNKSDFKECIRLYRESFFKLDLSQRVKNALNIINEKNIKIFIVTDGNSRLQRRKIEALGLYQWFDKDMIFVSGDYGREFQKPSTKILEPIDSECNLEGKKIAYFGDRAIDQKFAECAKFDFYYAPCMNVVRMEKS